MTDVQERLERDDVLASAASSGSAGLGGCTIRVLPPAARWSLRVAPAFAAAKPSLGGFSIDQPINTIVGDTHMSLRLGPDEWMLISEQADSATSGAITGAAGSQFHSLVDISHRNIAIELSGHEATMILSSNCPRDLGERAFPAGSATRTLFGKAEIILARPTTEPRFRIECWRSFARYTHGLIADAAKLQGIQLAVG